MNGSGSESGPGGEASPKQDEHPSGVTKGRGRNQDETRKTGRAGQETVSGKCTTGGGRRVDPSRRGQDLEIKAARKPATDRDEKGGDENTAGGNRQGEAKRRKAKKGKIGGSGYLYKGRLAETGS